MSGIKKVIIGIVIGLVVGLWAGVNIGKGQPIWANPFADQQISKQAKEKADAVIEDAKSALRKKLDEPPKQ
ncbi:hypothetical protein [Kaarinaea lacus]